MPVPSRTVRPTGGVSDLRGGSSLEMQTPGSQGCGPDPQSPVGPRRVRALQLILIHMGRGHTPGNTDTVKALF